jgi:hypothetical protein
MLEYHSLSSVRDCLFNIFAAYLEAVFSIRNLRSSHAVVTRWNNMNWTDLAQNRDQWARGALVNTVMKVRVP